MKFILRLRIILALVFMNILGANMALSAEEAMCMNKFDAGFKGPSCCFHEEGCGNLKSNEATGGGASVSIDGGEITILNGSVSLPINDHTITIPAKFMYCLSNEAQRFYYMTEVAAGNSAIQVQKSIEELDQKCAKLILAESAKK